MQPLEFCSFCNAPAPKHEGGAEFDGVPLSGKFCGPDCFESWLRWKNALVSVVIK